jgi:hypothetical protein
MVETKLLFTDAARDRLHKTYSKHILKISSKYESSTEAPRRQIGLAEAI